MPGLQSHPRADVVAICGRRRERAQAIAERFNIPQVYTDYQELCANPDIDAVTVVSPNVDHAPHVRAVLAAHKHVFCEKPLAMNLLDARKMTSLAQNSGMIHQVAFTFRYLDGIRELRRRVQRGDIGSPYYLRMHWEVWDAMKKDYKIGYRDKSGLAGHGVLFDVGAHLFDLARFVLGPIQSTAGFFKKVPRQRMDPRVRKLAEVETDDMAAAWFLHENGVQGQWFASRVTPFFEHKSHIEVIGTEGALRATLGRGFYDVLQASSPRKFGWKNIPLPIQARDKSPHALGIMMRSFVDACMRGKLNPETDASFHDGLATQYALSAVLTSNTRRRWVPIGQTVLQNEALA